ncbi:MAG: serine/threonine-protein kinase [Chloroflexota bacterium]|nr:serine/threonine-protein kinase [Chloroflexota bacterium]
MKTHDLVGKKLGEYKIIEQIGRGATANIYKAFQPKLNRYVAIKVLAPFFADERAFRERFVREAQAIAQLDHPNILPVYDFDQQGDLVYIVMQYVDTGSLADLMGKPMPLDYVFKILEQIGSALSYAHSQGIVHRDVKPDNILVGPGRWVLLTDFGLVKILADSSPITESGVGLGTPNYMAPEQVRGESVDPRADVYALGAMLYQMVTGCVPFEGESGMAVALKHLNEPLRPPRTLDPGLPPGVDHVIVKAMAKDRDLRYRSVDDLVAAFRQAMAKAGTGEGRVTSQIQAVETPITVAEPLRQTAISRDAQACPTPPFAPVPLESIWSPELEESPARGGSGWALLAALAGTLIGFFLLFWGLAVGINALLESLP